MYICEALTGKVTIENKENTEIRGKVSVNVYL